MSAPLATGQQMLQIAVDRAMGKAVSRRSRKRAYLGNHLVPDVPIDDYVPESVKRDIRRTVADLIEQGGQIRLIRIGYDDFHKTTDAVTERQHRAFRPMLCGYPVEWGQLDAVQVIAVRPDAPLQVANAGGHVREGIPALEGA